MKINAKIARAAEINAVGWISSKFKRLRDLFDREPLGEIKLEKVSLHSVSSINKKISKYFSIWRAPHIKQQVHPS